MSYESRAYDNEHGDPVVVLVVTGTHDVSRLVNMLARANCEQVSVGHRILRQVRRHNGGQAALRLLRDHGGPDFTGPPETDRLRLLGVTDQEISTARRAIAAGGAS